MGTHRIAKMILGVMISFVLFGMSYSAIGADNIVKIGVMLELSGRASEYGQHNLTGIKLAVDDTNKAGGIKGAKIELVVEDTGGVKTEGPPLVRKFAGRKDIVAIIGTCMSAVLIPSAPVAAELGIVMISPGSAVPWAGKFNDWTFRSTMVDSFATPILVEKIKEKWGVRTAAVIYTIDNDWAVGSMKDFEKSFKDYGIKILATEGFRGLDSDMSPQLTKIGFLNPDVLIVCALAKEAALVMHQARQKGLKCRFAGGAGLHDPSIYDLSFGAAEGTATGYPFDPSDRRPIVQNVVKKYREIYNIDPPSYVAYGYDAVVVLADALRRIKDTSDRKALRDALGKTKGAEGVTGFFTYQNSGDNITPGVHLFIMKGGKFVPFD